jgi:mannosyl-oligosaccharide alpha-1,2-mannosidase
MTPDNADILIAGMAHVNGEHKGGLDFQGQHLVCFAGGMFALGGKLFNDQTHLDMGRKVTDGCVWTYKAMPLGIMPEVFHMVECPTNEPCKWNETAWHKEVQRRKGGDVNHLEDVQKVIAQERLPPGFTSLDDRRYILRPEAIESVFILYRITGRKDLQESAWQMFNAIQENTKTALANGALADVSREDGKVTVTDSMESFWLAETLKYFYLIFSEPGLISLDDYTFNTEAHPFKIPK